MKFRREHKAEFYFTGPETFTMNAANGFRLTAQANVAVTRSAAKRQINEISDQSEHELGDSASEALGLERPFKRRLRLSSPAPLICVDSPSPLICSPTDLWHLRFGHASSTALRKLKQIKSTYDSTKCVPCIRAKKTHKPFHSSESKATQPLERVHSDICGQFPESKGNSIYNLTFLDEATQYAFAIPIPNKSSETIKKEFSQWIAVVERETGQKVRCLCTDGGGEYQGELMSVLKMLGVKHEKTPPWTPELNSKVERLNHTLNDTIRAMLIQANMPQSFWVEAMATAVYLKNQLPSEAIDNDVPFQHWFHRCLDNKELNILKPFGCIVWDYVDKQTHGR